MNNTLMACTDYQVRERRIQLLPLFEDYDPVRSGCVSHSQVTCTYCEGYYSDPPYSTVSQSVR